MISRFDQRSLINFAQFQVHHQGMSRRGAPTQRYHFATAIDVPADIYNRMSLGIRTLNDALPYLCGSTII